MTWAYNDGGRAAAGFRSDADDCVTRAIAIAAEMPYREVYAAMNDLTARGRKKGRRMGARTGVPSRLYRPWLVERGWEWTPTMGIGTGCRVHLRADELPVGRLIVEVSKHTVAVVDGLILDTYDPSRGGIRCVYGYFRRPE